MPRVLFRRRGAGLVVCRGDALERAYLVRGVGFRVWSSRFRVSGFGFRVAGLDLVQSLQFDFAELGFMVV